MESTLLMALSIVFIALAAEDPDDTDKPATVDPLETPSVAAFTSKSAAPTFASKKPCSATVELSPSSIAIG